MYILLMSLSYLQFFPQSFLQLEDAKASIAWNISLSFKPVTKSCLFKVQITPTWVVHLHIAVFRYRLLG